MKCKIGILIFGDPTRGGSIVSEVKFLSSLYETNKDTADFYIITVNSSVTKRISKDAEKMYSFPHEIVTVFGEEDFYKLKSFSCLLTYPGHSNFFGGYLNDNVVKMYKIVSNCTNDLKIPVYIRINDSEIKVRDYRLMSQQRLGGKPESAFMKDPINVKKAEDLVSWKQWDYEHVYWFANGSRSICNWVPESLYDREDEEFRMAPRDLFDRNAVYVSDDLLFLVKKNFKRFEHLSHDNFENSLCYVGFFDTVNMKRAKAFDNIFKNNSYNIPMKIFGKGTEILTKLSAKPNISIEEGFLKGDSDEYFIFLNSHVAYIFVGKGHADSRYIGKTVYDAIVARVPILVYSECDSKHIVFKTDEWYFRNEFELKGLYEKLKDPEIRKKCLDSQAEEIFATFPSVDFKFDLNSDSKPDLPASMFYVSDTVEIKKKEPRFKNEISSSTKQLTKQPTPLF